MGRAVGIVCLAWSVVLLESALAAAQTYTIHATIDPASRRHVFDSSGTVTETFACSYDPVSFDLSSYSDIAFDFTVAGGSFLETTTTDESVVLSLDDDTAVPDASCGSGGVDTTTVRTSASDLVWHGTNVPPTNYIDGFFFSSRPGSFELTASTLRASGPFRITGATYTHPSTSGTLQTHQPCGCRLWFYGRDGIDVALVWGPSVPRNVGVPIVTFTSATAAQCANGGVAVLRGLDDGYGGALAGDGVLDTLEVQETDVVCSSGTRGSTLVSVVPAGMSCSHGGTLIETGIDDGSDGGVAGDGILEPGEVQHSDYVCNGSSGCSVARTAGSRSDGAWFACLVVVVVMTSLRRTRARRGMR